MLSSDIAALLKLSQQFYYIVN